MGKKRRFNHFLSRWIKRLETCVCFFIVCFCLKEHVGFNALCHHYYYYFYSTWNDAYYIDIERLSELSRQLLSHATYPFCTSAVLAALLECQSELNLFEDITFLFVSKKMGSFYFYTDTNLFWILNDAVQYFCRCCVKCPRALKLFQIF